MPTSYTMKSIKLKILPGGVTCWSGRKGADFAVSVGREQRHMIAKFASRQTKNVPVEVLVEKFDGGPGFLICPFTCTEGKRVLFIYKSYAITINYNDVVDNVKLFVDPLYDE